VIRRFRRLLNELRIGWHNKALWNMPKKQPCPSCQKPTPRGRKVIGAEYHCKKCKQTWVVWRQIVIK